MMDFPVELLKLVEDCVVLLGPDLYHKAGSGSGFWIAPQLVLTCAHVVPNGPGTPIEVRWDGKTYPARVQRWFPDISSRALADGQLWPFPDIAVLRVDEAPAHPCALIASHEVVLDGRTVLLFGHSDQLDKHAQLAPLAIKTTVSGWSRHGEGRLWQVKQNEVLPGMSGGPALDMSTGQVIGLTTATIGEGSDRGGYIVPIDSVIDVADTELGGRLLAAGAEYHAEYPRWHLLSGQLQQRRAPAADGVGAGAVLRDGSTGPQPGSDDNHLIPEQLRLTVANFVGRAAALETLTSRLDEVQGAGAPVVILAISGTGGVGKTALALRWAHQVKGRFPDGQLFVDLRGYDSQKVVPAEDALAGFLVALGMSAKELPPADQRSAAFRTLAAGRRLLVVLDNATDEEHVRPLLPGSGTCVVVVTSRASLRGLVTVDGAARLPLAPLDSGEAGVLLRRLIGDRVDAEVEDAATLAEQCCRIPLALRITAELVTMRPNVPLRTFVAELSDVAHRLNLMDAATDPRSALRAVFSWSYQSLPAPVARAFRLLGLHPGTTVSAQTMARLANGPPRAAQGWLDRIVAASLADTSDDAHIVMHDLLREYARSLGHDHDTDDDRKQALDRLVEYYVRCSADAAQALFADAPDGWDAESAKRWLDVERENIVLVAAFATEHGWWSAAGDLSSSLWRYFTVRSHFAQGMKIHTYALTAARARRDVSAEGRALGNLGMTYWLVGRHNEALDKMSAALATFIQTGDQVKEAKALGNLGAISEALSRYDDAADYYTDSLDLSRTLGERVDEAIALDNLGNIEERRGNYPVALERHQQALDIFTDLHDDDREGITLLNFGSVYRRLGRYEQAHDRYAKAAAIFSVVGDRASRADALTGIGVAIAALNAPENALPILQEALAICVEVGDRPQEANTLANLARVLTAANRLTEAMEAATNALQIACDIGDQHLTTSALIALGEVALRALHPDEAEGHLTSAADLAASIGDRDEQSRSLAGLGYARQALGDLDGARYRWQEARELADQLGTPLAAEMAGLLDDVDIPPPPGN